MTYAHGRGGTKHHKIHYWAGWGVILGLPFAVWSAVAAIRGGAGGVWNWIESPLGAMGLLAFATAAIWYCKLEMDEVIMDYFDGGVRASGLLANRIVALILWLLIAYGTISLGFFWT